MHICIVGTGAAGWMATAALINLDKFIDNFPSTQIQITVIGSPEIPPIGVGESNTITFTEFHKALGLDFAELITRIDGTVKTGVLYDNWSPLPYLHNFKAPEFIQEANIGFCDYMLSFQNVDTPIQKWFCHDQFDLIQKNHFHYESPDIYPVSYHFDASKYIEYMSEKCMPFVHFIPDTVKAVNKTDNDTIHSLQLTDQTFSADYYIFATGSNTLPLEQNFVDLSNVLLTNKAWVYPLEYTNKREQFAPYTRAKTMKYGWRWITPTYSRIGTGYVFSDKYISPEDALQEFLDDIGDHFIEPRLVPFQPRYAQTPFHTNYTSIGMASGFLEPLDAPGLALTIRSIGLILKYLKNAILHYVPVDYMLSLLNNEVEDSYLFWTAFILAQYKTSHRNDTQFWIDHKNVQFDTFDHFMNIIQSSATSLRNSELDSIMEIHMFMHTMIAKGYKFNIPNLTRKPFKMPTLQAKHMHHLDYIEIYREMYRQDMLRVSDSNGSDYV